MVFDAETAELSGSGTARAESPRGERMGTHGLSSRATRMAATTTDLHTYRRSAAPLERNSSVADGHSAELALDLHQHCRAVRPSTQ